MGVPHFRQALPRAGEEFDANVMYRAMNKMFPSLIRTESDQFTYGMHIILRFEIEQEMINGALAVKRRARFLECADEADLLGVEVPDDTRACSRTSTGPAAASDTSPPI